GRLGQCSGMTPDALLPGIPRGPARRASSPTHPRLDLAAADESSAVCWSLPRTDGWPTRTCLAAVLTPGGGMRLLLTSAGISNTSIRDTLVDLLGKPIAESNALCIPTAAYASPRGASMAYQLIHGVADTPLCEVGWKSLCCLELTALPSIEKEHWTAAVQQTDALLVGGGDPLYLCYWMRQS